MRLLIVEDGARAALALGTDGKFDAVRLDVMLPLVDEVKFSATRNGHLLNLQKLEFPCYNSPVRLPKGPAETRMVEIAA